MLHQLLLAGGGIGYLPLWLIKEDLAAGRLVRLLPAYRFRSITLHAAYPERRHLSAKVRCMIDFLVEKAAEMPPQPGGAAAQKWTTSPASKGNTSSRSRAAS